MLMYMYLQGTRTRVNFSRKQKMKPDYWEALSPTESSLGIMRDPLCEEEQKWVCDATCKKAPRGKATSMSY